MRNSHERLCARCKAIFTSGNEDHHENEKQTHVHYHDGAAFINTAKSGCCYFCTWTWRALRWSQVHGEYEYRRIHHTKFRLIIMDGNRCRLSFYVYETERNLLDTSSFITWRTSAGGSLSDTVQTTLEPSTRSSQSLSLAKTWLEECNLNHPECQAWRQHENLPTRLIRVRQEAANTKGIANICSGTILHPKTPYLSLSHCWGKAKFLTTTRANISHFELSLPIDKLSRTFQDALLATKELGFEYIWIDSLCIIQDDVEDWTREASLMGEVYRNASCNISASAFASGEKGFMLPWRQMDPTPIFVKAEWESSKNKLLQSYDGITYGLVYTYPWDEISQCPLFDRAWTLQEQLLASRALHFGEDQIFWECKRAFANEVWPRGWMNTVFYNDSQQPEKHDITWQFKFENVLRNDVSPYTVWYNIIANYSHREVTFVSDRLPALAGISSKFGNLLDGTYLYGLWSKDLHHGVLFRQIAGTFVPHEPNLIPAWHNTPSWSWAALHQPVLWPNTWNHGTVKACRIEVLKPAILRFTGMIIPLRSEQCKFFNIEAINGDHRRVEGTRHDGLSIDVDADQWFLTRFEESWGDPDHFDTEVEFDSAVVDAFRTSVIAMPIIFLRDQQTSVKNHCETAVCLLLYSQPGLEQGSYRRVGIATMRIRSTKVASVDALEAALREYQEPLQSPWYHEINGDGEYVISVV